MRSQALHTLNNSEDFVRGYEDSTADEWLGEFCQTWLVDGHCVCVAIIGGVTALATERMRNNIGSKQYDQTEKEQHLDWSGCWQD